MSEKCAVCGTELRFIGVISKSYWRYYCVHCDAPVYVEKINN